MQTQSNPQSAFRVDAHDGQHGLVQDGVSHVLGRFGVGGHLRQYVVHGLAGVVVVLAQHPKQSDRRDLCHEYMVINMYLL